MKVPLSEVTGVPYWRQIRDWLADRIRAGEFAPGASLPSIRELALDSLVSVITVKKAYEELEAMNLVYSRQGRGTFVAEAAGDSARDMLHAEILAEMEEILKKARECGVDEARIRATLTRTYPTD